jgi:PHD/YefM family antitoxin component YafN of YafNO toxin-antitoxin module
MDASKQPIEVFADNFRANAAKYRRLARDGRYIILMRHSTPECVMVSMGDFRRLQRMDAEGVK